MDRHSDKGYELIELGHPTDADVRHTGPVLPPLDLGDVTDVPDEPPPAATRAESSWRRWAALVATFAVGVSAGAYGWQARHQAAENAEQAGQPELVAGALIGGADPGSTIQHLEVLLLNTGAQEIEVLVIHPPGWEAHPRTTTTIGAEEWTTVPMSVSPNCTAPPPMSLMAEVRSDLGEESVTVPLPAGGTALEGVYQQFCEEDHPVVYSVTSGRVTQLEPETPGTLRMRIELRSQPPGVEFEIVEAAASTGGVTGTGSNLPVPFTTLGRSPSALEMTWEVVRCELATLIGDINLDLRIDPPDGDWYQTSAQLPGQAVAMLARFAAAECAS